MADQSIIVESSVEDSSHAVIHQANVCTPIKSLREMWAYLKTPPDWIKGVIPINSRTEFVVKNEENDCHVRDFQFVPKVRYSKRRVPRTLVCHDMMNGYLADKFVGGINVGNGYTFYRWPQIDIFVYFSHHFLTIPPLPWINLSHKNGVPILGTFITEWDDGARICKEILTDKETSESVADALVNLCVLFKFDGWLINVENTVENPQNLIHFVGYLTRKLHENVRQGLVIWYDSVTKDGELKWQNELNNLNRCYFDVCDGIFVNYTWQEVNLERSVQNARHRLLDVYVGLDVFGRGCFGGGEFNSHVAAEAVRKHNLSLAIFGQGWSHERMKKEPDANFLERFYSRDSLLWKSLWPYLYTHPAKYPFTTLFYSGVKKDYYDLEEQDVQLSFFPSHAPTEEVEAVTLAKGICTCVQEQVVGGNRLCFVTDANLNVSGGPIVHRLFSTEMILFKSLGVVVYTLPTEHDCDYEIAILAEDRFGRIANVVCESRESGRSTEDTVRVGPSRKERSRRPSNVPANWDARYFDFSFDEYKILEIGIRLVNGHSLHLCGIGFTSKKQ